MVQGKYCFVCFCGHLIIEELLMFKRVANGQVYLGVVSLDLKIAQQKWFIPSSIPQAMRYVFRYGQIN